MKKFKIPRPGTGMMVTAAFIGPGTVTVCTRAGAGFGLSLLWALLFSVLATIILQNLAVKLTVVSGNSLAGNIRVAFTGKVLRVAVSVLVITAIFLGGVAYESGNIAGAALALNSQLPPLTFSIAGYSVDLYGFLIGAIAIAVLYTGKRRIIERVLILLVLVMSLVFTTTALLSFPAAGEFFRGLLVPSVPDGSLLMIVGLIGTTIVPYNLFLHSGALNAAAEKDERRAKTDSTVSIAIGGIISMAIVITAAFAFHGTSYSFNTTTDLAAQLEPLLGSLAGPFLTAGFFSAGITSAITAPLAAAFTVAGIMNWPQDTTNKRTKAVWLITILAGLYFYGTGIKPFTLITIAQVANGLLLPFVAVYLLVLVNDKKIMKGHTPGLLANCLSVAILLVVLFLGVRSVWNVF